MTVLSQAWSEADTFGASCIGRLALRPPTRVLRLRSCQRWYSAPGCSGSFFHSRSHWVYRSAASSSSESGPTPALSGGSGNSLTRTSNEPPPVDSTQLADVLDHGGAVP